MQVLRLNSGIQQRYIVVMELLEGAVLQFFTNTLHKMVIEIQVMHNSQTHAKQLVSFLQMANISTAEVPAHRAAALRVNRAFITLILCVLDVDNTVPGK